MDTEDRQFLLTTAWLFARHGQHARARALCEALVEDNPREGVSAAALAELQLLEGDAAGALATVRAAEFSTDLARVSALLEARALMALGKQAEGAKRWRRYVDSAKGGVRQWI